MQSHISRSRSVGWHRLMISGFVLAWIVSVLATLPTNQKVLVAQAGLESSEATARGRSEEFSSGTLKGVAVGVRGGVVGGVESSVATGVSGRVEGEALKQHSRGVKQHSEPPFGSILGPPSSGPGIGGGIGTGKGGGVGPGEGGGLGIGVFRVGDTAMNRAQSSPAQQAGSARLFGTVSDASQARVPNATIVVSNKQGGTKEITSSSAAGEFEFRTLPLGHYSVEVRNPGFRPFQQALELHANEPRELDIVLEVGEVAETVNVVAKAPPAAPPDTRSGPPRRIRVGGNVQATKLIHRVQPIYPEQAQVQGIQGTVLIEAVILKDGSMGAMRVLNKLADPDLVSSAVDAVKNWRYEPTLLNGQPIEIVTTITVNFRLSSSN